MSRRKIFLASVLSTGLTLALLSPGGAQEQDRTRGSDSQKPVVNTYDKRPDPRGRNQDIDAATYEQTDDRTQNVPTYNKTPDPAGQAQDRDAVRYEENNADRDPFDDPSDDPAPAGSRSHGTNNPERADFNPTSSGAAATGSTSLSDQASQPAENPRGDSVKPTLTTYDNPPEAQSPTATSRANDVSSLEEPQLGDRQKPVIPTYDKRPDPDGDSQDFDAVRYEERNVDNNGRPSELQMRVIEGSVEP